jgi:hypothetical protein
VEELIFRCQVAAQAVDASAQFYLEHASAAIARLTTLAAGHAEHAEHAGHAETDEPGTAAELAAAGHQTIEDLTDTVSGFMQTYLIGKAIEPLEKTVAGLVGADGFRGVWEVMTRSREVQPSVRGNTAEILRMAEVMGGLADAILLHAEVFSRRTSALDFE